MTSAALPTHVAAAIKAATAVPVLLTVVADIARELVPSHQAATTVIGGRSWAKAAHGFSLSDKYAAWRQFDENPDGSGIYRRVAELNQPMRLTQRELEAHPAWHGFGAAATRHPPMRGWLAVPLHGRKGQGIGVIQLSDRNEGEFTEEDEAILVSLAAVTSAMLVTLRRARRR
jgi:GAF domain-containing protein